MEDRYARLGFIGLVREPHPRLALHGLEAHVTGESLEKRPCDMGILPMQSHSKSRNDAYNTQNISQ